MALASVLASALASACASALVTASVPALGSAAPHREGKGWLLLRRPCRPRLLPFPGLRCDPGQNLHDDRRCEPGQNLQDDAQTPPRGPPILPRPSATYGLPVVGAVGRAPCLAPPGRRRWAALPPGALPAAGCRGGLPGCLGGCYLGGPRGPIHRRGARGGLPGRPGGACPCWSPWQGGLQPSSRSARASRPPCPRTR